MVTMMINYLGNHKQWICDNKIIEFLTGVQGEKTPVWQPDHWKGNSILDEYRKKAEPAYSHNRFFFHQLNPASSEIQNFNLELPELPAKRNNLNWWFVILYPGEFQPIHIDPALTKVKDPIRYTIFLQDWEPGHIFVYDDKILTNYKAGDMYEWNDPMIVHAPANVSYNTRYTLQITLYD